MRLDGSSLKRPITPQSSKTKQAGHDSAARGSVRQSQRQLALRAAKEEGKPAQEKGIPSGPNAPQDSRSSPFYQTQHDTGCQRRHSE